MSKANKIPWNHIISKLFIILLFVLFINPITVKAGKKKTSLYNKKVEIGLGSTWKENRRFGTAEVMYPIKGATYHFSSANKKIAMVKVSNNICYLTGVSLGRTTVTCTQLYKGKKKTIGKFTVVVRQATVYKVDNMTIPPGKYTSTFGLDSISYRREGAKYIFTCDKPGLNIIDKEINRIDSLDNPYVHNIQICEATPGQYKVTLKEIYKKKTRIITTCSITVPKTTFKTVATLKYHTSLSVKKLITNPKRDCEYKFITENPIFLTSFNGAEDCDGDFGYGTIYANEIGNDYVDIYERQKKSDFWEEGEWEKVATIEIMVIPPTNTPEPEILVPITITETY